MPPPPTPTPQSDKDALKKAVTDGLDSQSGTFRSINVVPQVDSGLGTFVEINGPTALPHPLTKHLIEYGMQDVCLVLPKSGKDMREMSVATYLPLVDQDGNVWDVTILLTPGFQE